MSGFSQPVLQDTRPIPWSTAHWINNLCELLHFTNSQIHLGNPWHLHPRCQGDCFIMEDALAYHFAPKKLQLINWVCTYLRVNLLSKITNHCGTQIITAMLYPAPRGQHDQYYWQNVSSLHWPRQPIPGPTAWKHWREFISWNYMHPDSMCLQNSLGPWLPTYDKDFTWCWQACPQSLFLFHYLNGQWWAFSPIQRYKTHIGYSHHPSPTSFPDGTVPATPIISPSKIHLPLPLSNVLPSFQPINDSVPLASRLTTPPEPWLEPLWHDIRPHAHSDTL